jgi:hypothetical protein
MLRSIRVRRRKQCVLLRRLRSFVIDAGRPFFIGRLTWVWSRGRGLNLRLLVDRQHEAVGSRYGIGDTGRRQFPAASRGGCHLAKSRRDTCAVAVGALFSAAVASRARRRSSDFCLSRLSALASIAPWFCFWPNFAVRSDAHQNPCRLSRVRIGTILADARSCSTEPARCNTSACGAHRSETLIVTRERIAT